MASEPKSDGPDQEKAAAEKTRAEHQPNSSAGKTVNHDGIDMEDAGRAAAQHKKAEEKYWRRQIFWQAATAIAAILAFGAAAIYAGFAHQSVIQQAKANHLAAQNFELSQRPYLSLGRKDGTVAEFTVPNDLTVNQPIGLKLYFQNGGLSPALAVNIGLLFPPQILVSAGANPTLKQPFQPQHRGFNFVLRSRDKNGGMNYSAGGISIAPQSEYVYSLPHQFSQEEWQDVLKGEGAPIINGVFAYCDEFGHFSCRFFSLDYEGPPENVFFESPETNCANMYGYPPAKSGQIYLLPCEQPNEREEREKKERQDMIEAAAKAQAVASPLPTPTSIP